MKGHMNTSEGRATSSANDSHSVRDRRKRAKDGPLIDSSAQNEYIVESMTEFG